ncbi:hypothetical protein [Streptomyces sp. NPDC002845]
MGKAEKNPHESNQSEASTQREADNATPADEGYSYEGFTSRTPISDEDLENYDYGEMSRPVVDLESYDYGKPQRPVVDLEDYDYGEILRAEGKLPPEPGAQAPVTGDGEPPEQPES